jgi:hypothetical protein
MVVTRSFAIADRKLAGSRWGCHVGRDTVTAITSAGFTIESTAALRSPQMRVILPCSPHLRGVASRN